MEENEKTSPTPEFEDQNESPTETAPESPPEQSLDDIAKQYNMTPAQVIKSYAEAQRKITEQGQELSSTRKRYQWADQFAHEINTRKGLREHIESFFDDSGTSAPAEVRQAADPTFHKVNELQVKLYNMEMNATIDALSREYPVDAKVRERIFEEVAKTGNPDVEAHYFKIMGPEFFSRSRGEKAREEARSKKDTYVQNRGTPSRGKGPDIKSMPKNEWSDALDDEISRAFRSTD